MLLVCIPMGAQGGRGKAKEEAEDGCCDSVFGTHVCVCDYTFSSFTGIASTVRRRSYKNRPNQHHVLATC